MNQTLAALYEIYRHQVLSGYASNPSLYDPGLVYAAMHRMAPLFHQSDLKEGYGLDPFSSVYQISEGFIDEVTQYMDDHWRSGTLKELEFSKLEDRFGGYRTNRMKLKHVCNYTRLSGRFDENVWINVERNAPIECKPIASSFTPEDIQFF